MGPVGLTCSVTMDGIVKTAACGVLAACAVLSLADDGESRLGFRLFIGQALLSLGSEDIRNGAGAALTYTIPYDRLRFRSYRGELSLETYYHASYSGGASGKPPNKTNAGGILALGRYRGRSRNGVAGYFELGWGFQYADKRTVDLDSRLNSTPTAGIGVVTRAPTGNEIFVGLRLMHVSNAGIVGRNQGQNQFFGTIGFKF
jgi:hypothetical protein